jgi:hypothetical protein
MIKSALEFLMNAGRPEVVEIDGHNYTTQKVSLVVEPSPAKITTSTLTGLVDYVKVNVDKIPDMEQDMLIHVVSENCVRLMSCLKSDAERDCYLECNAKTPRLSLDTYLEPEKFNVMMQSCFLDDGDRSKILGVVSNIKEENVRNTSDDGISQTVVAKVGVASSGYVPVPNPVTLVPFRTFIEVEQPESKFVLRIKDGPQIALFEADGGEWRLAAMLRIKKYLQEALPGINILA